MAFGGCSASIFLPPSETRSLLAASDAVTSAHAFSFAIILTMPTVAVSENVSSRYKRLEINNDYDAACAFNASSVVEPDAPTPTPTPLQQPWLLTVASRLRQIVFATANLDANAL